MLVEKKGEEVNTLLNKWRNRLGGCTSTSLFGNAVVSLRISLVRQLLDHSHATVNQSTQLFVRTVRAAVCVCMCVYVCVCVCVCVYTYWLLWTEDILHFTSN